VATVVAGRVPVVRSGGYAATSAGGAARRGVVRLRINLPGNPKVDHLAEDAVVSNGAGAAIARALKIMCSGGQRAVLGRMAASGGQPQIVHQRAAGIGFVVVRIGISI